MMNKLKEEMHTIQIPKDLHKRSEKGVEQAKSELKGMRKRRSKWLPYLATAACLAILIPIGLSIYANSIHDQAGQRTSKITNTQPNVTANPSSQGKLSKGNTSTHGLKKGETLMGGNPVAKAPVPNIQTKQYKTRIPVSVIHPNYAATTPKVPSLPTKVKMSVPVALAQKLTAYYFPLYGNKGFYIVAPNGMQGSGQVGQDGSYTISLKNASGAEVDLSSAGACQSCTVDSAALYFPSARKSAVDYGGYHGAYLEDLPVTLSSVNSNTKTFGYTESNQNQLAGFAYYHPMTTQKNGAFLNEVYVDTPKNVQSLAAYILQNTLIQNKLISSNEAKNGGVSSSMTTVSIPLVYGKAKPAMEFQVPSDWTKQKIPGGSSAGYEWVNPKNRKQKIVFLMSGTVGVMINQKTGKYDVTGTEVQPGTKWIHVSTDQLSGNFTVTQGKGATSYGKAMIAKSVPVSVSLEVFGGTQQVAQPILATFKLNN